MRALNLFLMGFLILFVSACALSPQQVSIKPKLDVEVADYGRQRDVNVRVEDRRSSPVIGTRGGIYGDTSTIEIGNDMQTEMAYTIAGALTRWGFRSTVNGYRGHALEYKVALDSLTYQPDGTMTGKMIVQANISVLVESGGSAYQGKYSAEGKVIYVTAPSARKNEAEINKVLNLALQQMFADQGLITFLQQ